ncbi:hypothetical protein ES704_03645 [subsurface metagenome]|jgi:hypothetical protein
MAYFANSTEGECFDEQCSKCKYGELPCPIWLVQSNHNYDACNNKIARQILDELVSDDGTCTMFEEFKKDFNIDARELTLYDVLFNGKK